MTVCGIIVYVFTARTYYGNRYAIVADAFNGKILVAAQIYQINLRIFEAV